MSKFPFLTFSLIYMYTVQKAVLQIFVQKAVLQIFVLICKNAYFDPKFKWWDFEVGSYRWLLSFE